MNLINNHLENKVTFYLKMLLIISSLLTAITPINHYFRNVYKIFFVICLPWLAYLFLKNKLYKKWEFNLLILFIIFYLITILLNRNHLLNELAMIGYLALFFFMSVCSNQLTKLDIHKEIKIILAVFLGITFIYSLCSFIMFLFQYQIIFEIGDSQHIFGMYEGRLWGLFNPNTGSMLYLAGIYSAVYFLKIAKKALLKYFSIIAIILEISTFVLCQSRGAWVCFLVFIISYILFVLTNRSKKQKMFLILLVLISFAVEPLYRNSLNILPALANQNNLSSQRLDQNKTADIDTFTSGRTGIWKAGLSGYIKSPIFGIGYRNIDQTLQQLPETVYSNVRKGGLHNVYLTILVSSGICGFLVWLAFIVRVLLKGLKYFSSCQEFKIIYLLIVSLLVADLVESRIMFGMNFVGIIFWLLIGYLICFYYKFKRVSND